MAQNETLIVRGLNEFMVACDNADKQTKKAVRATFRQVGNIVKDDAKDRLSGLSRKSADGYRTYVRRRGVSVEQSLRKTTGTRPDWGAVQMRKALEPALAEQEETVVDAFQEAMGTVVELFGGTT